MACRGKIKVTLDFASHKLVAPVHKTDGTIIETLQILSKQFVARLLNLIYMSVMIRTFGAKGSNGVVVY